MSFFSSSSKIKLDILAGPFHVTSPKQAWTIIMLHNQHVDMPHLSGGWITLPNHSNVLIHFVKNANKNKHVEILLSLVSTSDFKRTTVTITATSILKLFTNIIAREQT